MKRIFQVKGADGAGQVVSAPRSHRLAACNDGVSTAAVLSVEPLPVGLMVAAVFVAGSGFSDAD